MTQFGDFHSYEFTHAVHEGHAFALRITQDADVLVPTGDITVVSAEDAAEFRETFGIGRDVHSMYVSPGEDPVNGGKIVAIAGKKDATSIEGAMTLRARIVHEQARRFTWDPRYHSFYSELLAGVAEKMYFAAALRSLATHPDVADRSPDNFSISEALVCASTVDSAFRNRGIAPLEVILRASTPGKNPTLAALQAGLALLDKDLPDLIDICDETPDGHREAAFIVVGAVVKVL